MEYKFNKQEKEIILLYDVLDIISDSVNKNRSILIGEPNKAEIKLKSEDSRKVFLLNILELISTPTLIEKRPNIDYLDLLIKIAEKPQFSGDPTELRDTTLLFKDYLNNYITIKKCWLPSIEIELNLKIKPRDMIYISANSVKHGLTKLTPGVSNKIKKVMRENNIIIKEDDWFQLIGEFQEWLFHDILAHQVTALSEFLNNIKYGIYTYFLKEGEIYFPEHALEIDRAIVKFSYYELISEVKRIPDYFPKFTSYPLLKNKKVFH